MFGGANQPADYADGAVALKELRAWARRRNQADAQLVSIAAACYQLAFDDDLARLGDHAVERCGDGAAAEISLTLGIAPATATRLIVTGLELDRRMPHTRAAFAAGDLDMARVRTIIEGLCQASDATLAAVEPAVVDAALQHSPRALGNEITRLLIEVNPVEAEAIRKARQKYDRTVTVTPDRDGMSKLLARLTASEGIAVNARIEEMVATVCKKDPRTIKALRTDAFVSLMHGEQYLICGCDTDDCPTKHLPAPSRPGTDVHIHVDLDTLLGLLDNPAAIEGHGPIGPGLARKLADDATWHTIIDDLRNGETGTYESGCIPQAPATQPDPEPRPVAGLGGRVAQILTGLDASPDLLAGEFPDGHGGHDCPPAGALTYRPRKAVREKVFAKYPTCTFPNVRHEALLSMSEVK